MPCQMGQNIYLLRKENRQLLNQLESNSVLLENKIQRLRRTTRIPRKSDYMKNEILASSVKRRHTSWNARNSSNRVASALIKPDFSCAVVSSDSANNHEIPEKSHACNNKKTPVKRIRRNAVNSKLEIKKSCTGQLKGKIQTNVKKVTTQCYCSKMCGKHACHFMKLKGNPENEIEQLKNSKHLKVSVSTGTQTNDKIHLSDKSKYAEVPDLCSNCMEKAQHLLNYSPESLFLRRMKGRLQKFENKPVSKCHSKITQICNCENTQFHGAESDDKHSYSASHMQLKVTRDGNHSSDSNSAHDLQEDENTHCATCGTSHGRESYCMTEKTEHKNVESLKKSKELIDTHNKDSGFKVSGQPQGDKYNTNTKTRIESKGNTSHGNKHERPLSAKTSYIEEDKRCLCKKEIGGLCCCEVSCSWNSGTRHHSPLGGHGDTSLSSPLKSPESAPVIPVLKSNKSTELKQGCSGICGLASHKLRSLCNVRSFQNTDLLPGRCNENETELKLKLPQKIQSAGYDVIDDHVDNDNQKYSADPCIHHLEELSQFRQKHWFDCHAHPHGMATDERCSDSKESYSHVGRLDDDPMQPTKDSCTRSYRLNQRLFPEMVTEVHGTGCCVSREGGCVSTQLLPTQRRLITLPTMPQRFSEENCDTVKQPRGMLSFSNVLIHDTVTPAPVPTPLQIQLETKDSVTIRSRQPVPSNSLALRFQKGVA